jgi:antagonist of KipI
MSFKIIKPGILDTIQDLGRTGYQHWGINPGGAMDKFSASLANALLGKNLNSPVVEIHFPAASILFNRQTIITLSGADFTPTIDGKQIPLNQPVVVNKKCTLQFKRIKSGFRCYLSFFPEMKINKWLNSFSTNLKANAGGWRGRALEEDDEVEFENKINLKHHLGKNNFILLPWRAVAIGEVEVKEIEVIKGNEWHMLNEKSKNIFENKTFRISHIADRMGYRLISEKMELKESIQLISSAVSFGTLQLPADGQFIILMADHQTTGGYPRIAHIISAHLPVVAQMKPNDEIKFKLTEVKKAEQKIIQQQMYLKQVQSAAIFKMEKLATGNLE